MPVWIRQQIHGKHDGGAGCQEQVVNVTERLVAKEWNKVPQETCNAVWLGSTCSRHDEETDDECVGLHLKQGVFPKHDHHQKLV